MKAKLVVVKGAKPVDIPLRLPTVIGRSSEAALKVRTTVVSRKHCELFEEDGHLFVRDLESANGTFVNKVRIDEPTRLDSGDLLEVGPVTLRADYEQPAKKKEKPSEVDGSMIDLGEELAGEDSGLSMVNYKETPKGSFLGIEDVEEDAEAVEEAGPLEDAEILEDADLVEEADLAVEAESIDEPAAKAETLAPAAAAPKVAEQGTKKQSQDATDRVKASKGPAGSSAAETAQKTVKSKEAEEAAQALGGEETGDSVKADDSALNDFFNNLG